MARSHRIVQRITDGKLFTWTVALAKRPKFRSGTLYMDDDGNQTKLDLDQLGSADLARVPGISEREKHLMNENQALQERIRIYERGEPMQQAPSNTVAPITPLAPLTPMTPITPLSDTSMPESIPLPVPPSDLEPITLDTPIEEETAIQFQPEPKMFSKTKLSRMKNEDLIVHAHHIQPGINLPDNAEKRDLVDIVEHLQNHYKTKTQS